MIPNVLRAKCIIVGDPSVGKSAIIHTFLHDSDKFQKNYIMTCAVETKTKIISVPDTEDAVELYLFDSAGRDIYLDFQTQMASVSQFCTVKLMLIYSSSSLLLLMRNQERSGVSGNSICALDPCGVEQALVGCTTHIRNTYLLLWQHPSLVCVVFDLTDENSFNSCSKWLDVVKNTGLYFTIPGVLIGSKSDLKERRVVKANVAQDYARKNNLRYFECSAKENKGVEEPFFYLVNEWHKMYLENTEYFKSIS